MSREGEPRRPEATIVIPTHNRSDALIETLEALSASAALDGGWEAVVVDDGSTDDTSVVIPRRIESHRSLIRYLRQDNHGAAAARNRGGREARGRFLIFIDND